MTFHLTCQLHKLLKAEIILKSCYKSVRSSNLYADLSFNYRRLNETRVCAHPVLWSRDWDQDCFNHLTRQQPLGSTVARSKKVLSSSPPSGCGLSQWILSGIFRVCVINTHFVKLGYIYLQFSLLTIQEFLRYILYID